MPNYDAVREKQLELQRLLEQLWKSGTISEKDYLQKLSGIDRCLMYWRKARKSPALVLKQLDAVEDELRAEISRPKKARPKS